MTAPLSAGFRPSPTVTINGVAAAQSAPATGPIPSGYVAVLDDFRIIWGTTDPLEQAPPAAADLSLVDFTLTWATTNDLIGLPVTIGWTWSSSRRTMFRGRIVSVELTRFEAGRPDGSTVPAVQVDLRCVSVETDLANRFPTELSWPAEPIGARAARIAAYCSGVASAVYVRDYWANAQAAPVASAHQTSIRDLLVQLYNSTGGDRMVYSPDRQTYEWLGRRVLDQRGLQRLTYGAAGHPREGKGAWVAPDFTQAATGVDGQTQPLLYLDARYLEEPESLSRAASSRITRVVVGSRDAGAADAQRSALRIDPNARESVIGQRALTLDSLHHWNDWADLNAEDLLAMATQEAATWRPGAIRWDTSRSDGFELTGQFALLLRGHIVGWPFTIGRSWLPVHRIRPLFGLTGGVIAYREGYWVVDMHVCGYAAFGGGNATPLAVKQHAITFEEIDDGTPEHTVRWWDDDQPDGLHASLTFDDLGFVGRGRGATTIGPNMGFDR